ncbi:GSCOCG00007151001-RA-CDS [Cotesia congregata]|nr:GSCOCG00007151001-RA-CDS [Cotesia congregata]
MFKRTTKDMNFPPSKKQRLSSSKSSEKENQNLSVDEDSGLGPEIDNESSSDEAATSFGSQNSHFASQKTNINSKTPDFDRDSQSSEFVTQRRTRSLSLQDTSTMKKLVTHQPNAVFDKSPRKLSLRPKKIRQSSTPDIVLFFEDAADDQLVMSPQHDEHSSMEVDEAIDIFSQFSATQASKDNFNINTILETLESPLKNGDLSKASPVKIQSQHLENGNEILLTDSSVSTSQTNAQATEEETEKEGAELTQDSLSKNSTNDHADLFNRMQNLRMNPFLLHLLKSPQPLKCQR